ncbi:MAG: hypothetical protein ACLQU1_09995 [Bryobacteraceae bacterium]
MRETERHGVSGGLFPAVPQSCSVVMPVFIGAWKEPPGSGSSRLPACSSSHVAFFTRLHPTGNFGITDANTCKSITAEAHGFGNLTGVSLQTEEVFK